MLILKIRLCTIIEVRYRHVGQKKKLSYEFLKMHDFKHMRLSRVLIRQYIMKKKKNLTTYLKDIKDNYAF